VPRPLCHRPQRHQGRISGSRVLPQAFGNNAEEIFAAVKAVEIVACGTSFHAGLVSRYWIESLTGLPCNVEVASEYRYRKHVVPEGGLFVTLRPILPVSLSTDP